MSSKMNSRRASFGKTVTAAPKPVTFIACGHTTTNSLVKSNPEVNFDPVHNVYQEPSLCNQCDVNHYKNRMKLISDTCVAKIEEEKSKLIEESLEIENAKDREEVLLTGSNRIMADLKLQRDTEILLLWGRYAQVWGGMSGVFKGRTEVLSVNLSRDLSGVHVDHVWKIAATGAASKTVRTASSAPAKK